MDELLDICNEYQHTATLTCVLKLSEVPFLSTNDSGFSWQKYQILKYLVGWLKTTEVRPGVYENSGKQKMLI